MKKRRRIHIACIAAIALHLLIRGDALDAAAPPRGRASQIQPAEPINDFSFAIAADTRWFTGPEPAWDTPQYFRGAVEAIAADGRTDFMIMPGDIDPPDWVDWTIHQYLGEAYPWYPVVGNHDLEEERYMDWLRAYNYDANGELLPHIVNSGPPGSEETTYAFDYGNAHFVVLNEYYDGSSDTGSDGDVVDALYDWLVDDLNATDKQHVFVIGHEPGYPQPDADNGRERHMSDSLNRHPDTRDRFWALLRQKGVVAYLCGHTHDYSAVRINGVWQLDTGHARGIADTGARSTFILIHVDGDTVTFETYRDDAQGGPYTKMHEGTLIAPPVIVNLTVPQGEDAQQTAAAAEQLAADLSAQTGYKVHTSVAACDSAAIDTLAAGEADAAWLSAPAHVAAHEQISATAHLRALQEDGTPYQAQFLTRSDSAIRTLADLMDKTFAFVSPTSDSGYRYPAVYISNTQGMTPTRFFSQTLFAGSPEAVAEAVYTGAYEGMPVHGGAIYDDARKLLLETYPDILTATTVLTYTPGIPESTVSLHPALIPTTSQQLISGLLTLADTPAGQQALRIIQGRPRLQSTTETAYEATRQVAAAFSLTPTNCSEIAHLTGALAVQATYTTPHPFTTTVQVAPLPVSETLRLSYTPIPALTHRPGGSRETGLAFTLRAAISGTTRITGPVTLPYTLTVTYAGSAISSTDASALALYYWDGTSWQREPSSHIDVANHVLQASPNHTATRWTLLVRRAVFLPAILRNN